MPTVSARLGLLVLLALSAPALAQEEKAPATALETARFPASTALAQGVSPEALDKLDQVVAQLAADGDVVGAELLVIVNGHTILHTAHGWADLEAEIPMETGSLFCVRSMTKPLIGTALQMLMDERVLSPTDHISEYLPAFDVEGKREITVDQLLHHTSGLPMSLILGQDLEALGSIRAVADLGGGAELEFEPGTGFHYSDQGTDTLTALIEVASGMSAAEFVRTRILEPLGMEHSTCVLAEDSPLRAEAIPKYVGSRGAWTRFWEPTDPPLFPFFLGSQGLYATLEDYARFADFWLRRGRTPSERLLRTRYVRKALEPGPYPVGAPTGFPELRTDYGALMQLWTGLDDDGEREVVAFGHTGSDGTHAWVLPEQKAMVLYFTQSRNNTTGLAVEEALGELFLGVPFDPNQAAPPLEQYLGFYWEGEGDLYRAIVRDGDDLALEILGKAVVPLTYIGEDRWKLRPKPTDVLAFDRSESGVITGYHVGDHQEFRFEPSRELPSAAELAERVAAVHRVDLLQSIGPVRMRTELSFAKLGMQGEAVSLFAWPDRVRLDALIGEEEEHVVIDGAAVHYASRTEPAGPLEGARAESLRVDTLLARFGDWAEWYPSMQTIQRMPAGDEEVYLVRMGDLTATAPTLYVHAVTGRVVHQDSVVYAGVAGRIGQRTSFGDFRDVSGMLLPFRSETDFSNPMLGTLLSTLLDVELGVELAEDAFALED